jgi:hypothetical protein
MGRYIVSAASDPTVASHAGADRLCGRNRRFVYDVSITNNCSSNLMSHSVKVSVNCLPLVRTKSKLKFPSSFEFGPSFVRGDFLEDRMTGEVSRGIGRDQPDKIRLADHRPKNELLTARRHVPPHLAESLCRPADISIEIVLFASTK